MKWLNQAEVHTSLRSMGERPPVGQILYGASGKDLLTNLPFLFYQPVNGEPVLYYDGQVLHQHNLIQFISQQAQEELDFVVIPIPTRNKSVARMARKVAEVMQRYIPVFMKKQEDYGSGNISRFGEKGVVVRAYDKVERLANLLLGDNEPSNESVEDTWKDLFGYAAIGYVVHRGEWE